MTDTRQPDDDWEARMHDDPEIRELEKFAGAAGQPNQPRGHALTRQATVLTPIGAQPLQKYRDEGVVKQKLTQLAAMAGDDWFYEFPAGKSTITGPSIKLANAVQLVYGNCRTEIREVDVGDAWVFYACFTDFESGAMYERAYRQRKSQTSMRTKDRDRQLDIAYQIGQSKAIRNVICNALQIYCDYAFDEARHSLVSQIEADLAGWRAKTVRGLERLQIGLSRVEHTIGHAVKDWTPPDIARIVAMGKAVSDGMATVDEVFPAEAPTPTPDPKNAPAGSAEPLETASPASAPLAAQQDGPAGEATAAPSDIPVQTTSEGPPAEPKPATKTVPRNKPEYLDLVRAVCNRATNIEELRTWFMSPQQKKIRNGAGMVTEEINEARDMVLARIEELAHEEAANAEKEKD